MSTPIIEVRNLTKRYHLGAIGTTSFREELSRHWDRLRGVTHADKKEFWALRDVSFDVNQGEVVGVIGRNGAGKSTLLKILSRITEPTSGTAKLRGRVASLLEVGTGFHPELTGRENVFLNGAILGMTRTEVRRKFDEIVAFAEIEQFIDTPVKRYSSGMYIRLAFAVAAHLEPEILIVDEVLAVGDAAFQEKCIGKMGDSRANGVTTLIVSHSMAVICNLCDRAILLKAGHIEALGRPAEITDTYLAGNTTAKGFANWPDATTAPQNDGTRLQSVGIYQKDGEAPSGNVDISKEISIKIQYWNTQPGQSLYAAIWLRDHQGTVVLASGSTRHLGAADPNEDAGPRRVGLLQSECRIPADFLNEGTYSVTAIIGRGISETRVLHEHAVSFQVHDTGSMRHGFYGTWVGTVRPRLAWSTIDISNSA